MRVYLTDDPLQPRGPGCFMQTCLFSSISLTMVALIGFGTIRVVGLASPKPVSQPATTAPATHQK